ncbi:MAG: hypothetical protein RL059_928 [Bacteroidota bacterium]|jgi:hypothetical protein
MAMMKKTLIVLAVSICLGFSNDNPQNDTFCRKGVNSLATEKMLVLLFCQQYAPDYVPMLESSYSSPNSWSRTVGGVPTPANFNANDKNDVIAEFETIIHESTHHKNTRDGIYLGPNKYLLFTDAEKNDVQYFYKSELIAEFLPIDAEEKIFRFETYIGEGSGVSANLSGIFGLMDEYSAYQNGCSAALVAYDNALQEKDTTLAITFFKDALATYYAYYEFNSFIGAYLKYGKTKEPIIYQKIMNNSTLRRAYSINTIEFEKAIATINSQSNRLKSNYKLVKSSLEYYKTKYEVYAKSCMTSFQPELTNFKLN